MRRPMMAPYSSETATKAMSPAGTEFEPKSASSPMTTPTAGPTISALTTKPKRHTHAGTPTTAGQSVHTTTS